MTSVWLTSAAPSADTTRVIVLRLSPDGRDATRFSAEVVSRRMDTRLLIFSVAVPALSAAVHRAEAQSPDEIPSLGTRITIESTILGEQRALWVWTPPGYSAQRPGLPVLYMLDPEVHYRHATALVHFLGFYLRAPEMIVVGVVSRDRDGDFLLPRASSPHPGRADRFLRFLQQELQPHIRRRYNTADFSILAGHSLGGVFAVHAAITAPQAFAAVVAMSPSLDWADSVVLRAAREAVSRRSELPRFLYLAYAANERPGIAVATRALRDALSAAQPDGTRWSVLEVAGENHLTAPLPALHAAFRWLFADWVLPIDANRMARERSITAFDEYLARLSRQFGYDVQPSELIISMIGDRLYRLQAWNEAIALFRRRVALYPQSAEAHDELARGYEAAGRVAEAITSYERAVTLAEAQRHPSLDAIRARLTRVRQAR